MKDKAVLRGKTVVTVDTNTKEELIAWAEQVSSNKRVAEDFVGDVRVSTVFLGFNHGIGDLGDLWFETMIFGGDHDLCHWRYETWGEAERGHKRAVNLVKQSVT